MIDGEQHSLAVSKPRLRRRSRQRVKRSRTARFDLNDEEFSEVGSAAESAGLAKGAYAAQVVLAAARSGSSSGEFPLREALGEFVRAAGLVRRIGVNLNQAVAKLKATGQPDDLKHALQTRWEDSLRDRATIAPRSPVPLLDELLTAEVTHQNQVTPQGREKMISQNPPNRTGRPARPTLAIRGEPELTASDLARCQKSGSGAKGIRTPDPLVANNRHHVHQRPSPQVTVPGRVSGSTWIRVCCGTFLLYPVQDQGTVPRGTTHVTGWPVTWAMSS